MGRQDLLQLLPDFSETPRRSARQPRARGFEPLVEDALSSVDGFAPLDMPIGLSGLGPLDAPEPDPFADIGLPDAASGEQASAFDPFDLAGTGIGEEMAGLASLTGPHPEPGPPEPALLDPAGPEPAAAPVAQAVDFEAEREAMRQAFEEEVARIERKHVEALDSLVTSVIPKLRQEISEAVTDELAPLLAVAMRDETVARTLDAFAAETAVMLEDAGAVSFELRGPQELLAAFSQRWSEEAPPAKLVRNDGVDLVARIDRSVIATRLGQFDRLIREALA